MYSFTVGVSPRVSCCVESWKTPLVHSSQPEAASILTARNLTKLLQTLAKDAPEPQVDDLIDIAADMFKPHANRLRRSLAVTKLEEVADARRGHVFL